MIVRYLLIVIATISTACVRGPDPIDACNGYSTAYEVGYCAGCADFWDLWGDEPVTEDDVCAAHVPEHVAGAWGEGYEAGFLACCESAR